MREPFQKIAVGTKNLKPRTFWKPIPKAPAKEAIARLEPKTTAVFSPIIVHMIELEKLYLPFATRSALHVAPGVVAQHLEPPREILRLPRGGRQPRATNVLTSSSIALRGVAVRAENLETFRHPIFPHPLVQHPIRPAKGSPIRFPTSARNVIERQGVKLPEAATAASHLPL